MGHSKHDRSFCKAECRVLPNGQPCELRRFQGIRADRTSDPRLASINLRQLMKTEEAQERVCLPVDKVSYVHKLLGVNSNPSSTTGCRHSTKTCCALL
jgi:hypothetical protein